MKHYRNISCVYKIITNTDKCKLTLKEQKYNNYIFHTFRINNYSFDSKFYISKLSYCLVKILDFIQMLYISNDLKRLID